MQDYFGSPVENRLLMSKNNKNSDQLGGIAIIQEDIVVTWAQGVALKKKKKRSQKNDLILTLVLFAAMVTLVI